MPGRDGTGPQGAGPRTGRGMGNCAGGVGLGTGRGLGRGMGRGLGRVFGYRKMASAFGRRGPMGIVDPEFYEAADPTQKKAILEDQVAAMEIELSRIRNQLKNLPE